MFSRASDVSFSSAKEYHWFNKGKNHITKKFSRKDIEIVKGNGDEHEGVPKKLREKISYAAVGWGI